MRSILRIAPLICAAFLPAAFAQTGPAGHWEGTVSLPNRELQIAFDLAKDDKGAWTGSFTGTTQNIRGVPLGDIKIDAKNNISFRIAGGGPNTPEFDCRLEGADSMRCTLTTPMGSAMTLMKRTGDAEIDLPKPSPAVSAEFEGDWAGTLDTPRGSLKLIVHFKNQPDKTVQATIDSPDQGSAGMPLTDVVQKESALEFHLRMVNGSFKGTLNKEATQLTGDWTQGNGSSVPLVLKKAAAKN